MNNNQFKPLTLDATSMKPSNSNAQNTKKAEKTDGGNNSQTNEFFDNFMKFLGGSLKNALLSMGSPSSLVTRQTLNTLTSETPNQERRTKTIGYESPTYTDINTDNGTTELRSDYPGYTVVAQDGKAVGYKNDSGNTAVFEPKKEEPKQEEKKEEPKSEEPKEKKKKWDFTDDELNKAKDVIYLKYGYGQDRFNRLASEGFDAARVQRLVDEIVDGGERSLYENAEFPEKTREIKSGDSLWQIAQEEGVTVDYLRNKNGIKPGDSIHPGQVIKI